VRLSPQVLVQDNEIGLPFDFTGTPSPHQRQRSERTLAALPVTAALGPWQLEAQLARSDGSLAIADADDPFAASSSETRRESARGVVSRRFGDEVWLGAGLDWQRETAATASAFGAGLDGARQRTAAAFAQGSWARGPLRFDLGLRRDDNDAFGGATSLKTGAVVELAPGARLRASYGESFRAPALGDLYFPGFGNPELEPERGESWELAGELERGALRARAAGFHNDLDQLIQFDFARALPFNIGRARTRGVEGSLELRPGRFRARADAQWLEAEDRATGAPLPRRPEWSGALVAAWHGERLDLGAAWRLVGAREDVGRQALAGYTVVDLTVARPLGHGLTAFARLGNALDRDYEEAIGYPAPGRSWAAGLALRAD
jgi:vitamin B12 transporter